MSAGGAHLGFASGIDSEQFCRSLLLLFRSFRELVDGSYPHNLHSLQPSFGLGTKFMVLNVQKPLPKSTALTFSIQRSSNICLIFNPWFCH